MSTCTLSLSCAALVLAAGVARAEPPALQPLEWSGQTLSPVRVAQLFADGSIGPWIDTTWTARGGCAGQGVTPQWDSLRADLQGGLACGLPSPSSRWSFGTAWTEYYFVNDFGDAAYASRPIDALTMPVVFYGVGDSSATANLMVIISLFDDVDATCSSFPPHTGFVSGIILDYGSAATGSSYFLTADLCGVAFHLPADGQGAMEVFIAESYDTTTGAITPHSCDGFFSVQPLYWGTWDDEPGAPFRPGTQAAIEFADAVDEGAGPIDCVNTGDGAITSPEECWDNTFPNACPTELCPCIVFYTSVDDCLLSPADMNTDGTINGLDVGLFLSAYAVESQKPPGICAGCASDINADGTANGIDVGLFLSAYAACVN